MSIKLSKRLQTIAEMLRYESLHDVGSDHALLPVYLILQGRVAFAVASDIAAEPLERGRANAVKYGIADSIEFVLADGLGLSTSRRPCSCVIAGMGGEAIMRILTDNMGEARGFRQLLLSPQRDVGLLRQFLCENGFEILDEVMLFEAGKYYSILDAKPGTVPKSTGQSPVHLIERCCPVYRQYLEAEIAKFEGFGRDEHLDYIKYCKEVLECIK